LETTRLQRVFAQNLKFYRDRMGLSQASLAEKAGISLNFLSMIEVSRKFPSPDNIQNLASALGIKVYYLFIDPDEFNFPDDPLIATFVTEAFTQSLTTAVAEATRGYFAKKGK